MAELSIGSVCSGIGGLELGLEAAGLGPTRWQIEIDPYCRAVLARHWPDAVRHEDLKHVAADPSVLPRVDIICGGTPCQDLSLAGRGAGLSGARSGLWFDMLRIVSELRPAFVVWENVPGSLRRGLDVVVSGLCELGYEVVGTRLRAEDLGALHRRERVFLVGRLPDAIRELVREQHRRGGGRVGKERPSIRTMATRGEWPDTSSERGHLSPVFVERLMGFPLDHTVCELSETPSRRRKPRSSAGSSATSGKDA